MAPDTSLLPAGRATFDLIEALVLDAVGKTRVDLVAITTIIILVTLGAAAVINRAGPLF